MMNRFEDVLQKLDSYHMEVDIISDLNRNVGATSPDCSTKTTRYLRQLPV